MIDLHCHILPGIDDGAPDVEASVEMARAAAAAGTKLMVATPHVSPRWASETHDIARLVGELNIELAQREIPIGVVGGAEIAIERLPDLDDDTLASLCLGDSRYLLVESPYSDRAGNLEDALFAVQLRGFRPVLAHPERCPTFQQDVDRLAAVVGRDVACSVTAESLTGRFGSRPRRTALRMLRDGLVHSVASDAHDHERRGPALTAGLEHAERELPGVAERLDWFVSTVPAAILADSPLPESPAPLPPSPSRLRRLVQRARPSGAAFQP